MTKISLIGAGQIGGTLAAIAEQRRRLADVIASAARMTAVKTLRDAPVVVEIMVVGRDGTCWGTAGG